MYRAGQSLSGLWTARWPETPGGSLAVAGMVGPLSGIGVGYVDGTPGMWRRVGGQRGHYRLTITHAAGDAPEDVTVTAGGVAKVITVPAGSSTCRALWWGRFR